MNGSGHSIIEIIERASVRKCSGVKQIWKLFQLGNGLCLERAQEVMRVDARKPMFEMSRSSFQIVGHGYANRRSHLRRQVSPAFPEPLEEDIPAKTDATDNERLFRMFANEPLNYPIQVRRLAGVIHPPSAIQHASTSSEDQRVCGPTSASSRRKETLDVV